MIYTNDIVIMPERADRRIGKIYKFLERRKLSYGEIVHIPMNGKFLVNFIKRRRPIIYLEAIDFIFYFFSRLRSKRYFEKINFNSVDLGEFSEKERPFVRKTLSGYFQKAEAALFKVIFLARIFNLLGIRKILLIDDVRYYHELILAAKIAKVESIAVQHAVFTKYVPGHAIYEIPPERCVTPDIFCVWNKYWRERLINLSRAFKLNEGKIRIGGKPSSGKTNLDFLKTVEDDFCTILIPYEPHANKKEIFEYINELLKCPKTAVIFKLRKDQSEKEQINQFGLQFFLTKPSFSATTDLEKNDLLKVDLVAGTYSTLIYEMIEMGKPVGVFKSSTSEAGDLVSEDLADWIGGNSDSICGQISKISATSPEVLKRRASVLRTDRNIEEFLINILAK